MKRGLIGIILAGCSGAPGAPPLPTERTRTEGVVFTGAPGGASVAACDRFGRWRAGGPTVEHWIELPDERKTVRPPEGSAKLSLFRQTVPLPQVTWGGSDVEVTQLLYPAGGGFVARYHVMNHGTDPRNVLLRVSAKGGKIARADGQGSLAGETLTQQIRVEPGMSHFVSVTTPDLAGQVTPDLLDKAVEAWESRIGARKLSVPDEAAVTAYYADLAGAALGVAGCAEAVERLHARLARREGDALRLFPDVPEEWVHGDVEIQGLPTPFGPLGLRSTGVFATRSVELSGTCAPPGGFLIAVPAGYKATVDGAAATVKEGLLRVPGNAKKVEMSRAP